MAYSVKLAAAARRHFQAAEQLNRVQGGEPSVAGYLYGIAAECALKQIMRESGIYPIPNGRRRDDPFYAHFPQLKTMLLDAAKGRRAGELRRYAEDGALMSEWDTDMRYAPAGDVQPRWVERWREHAHRLVNAMEME